MRNGWGDCSPYSAWWWSGPSGSQSAAHPRRHDNAEFHVIHSDVEDSLLASRAPPPEARTRDLLAEENAVGPREVAPAIGHATAGNAPTAIASGSCSVDADVEGNVRGGFKHPARIANSSPHWFSAAAGEGYKDWVRAVDFWIATRCRSP